MITRERARQLRRLIVQAAQSLSDTDALQGIELYDSWKANTEYILNDRIRYNSKLYKVVQAHTSQSDWTPDITPALYTEIAPEGVIPVWRQPTGAQDAYMTGDKVYYPDENGDVWQSTVDNNVWQPGIYGWEVVTT